MFIIIHNKLINKCYFGTFGKHSVFGNGDVSNRMPNLRNWYSPGSVTTALLISLTCLFYRLSTCSLHLRDFLVWLTFKNVLKSLGDH